jgi:probable HAF family extracellular repeat protein
MRLGFVACVCAALVLSAPGLGVVPAAGAGEAPVAFALADLGQPGEADSIALAINDDGAVAVHSRVGRGSYGAALWRDGVRTELGAPPGYAVYFPADIDASGGVVGTAYAAPGGFGPRGFLWRDGRWAELGLPPGHAEFAVADRSEAGHIVGTAYAAAGGVDPRGYLWHADTGWVDLGADFSPSDVDAAGHVAGAGPFGEYGRHAALWRDGAWADLGVLAGDFSDAAALNAGGQVAGTSTYSLYPFGRRAALWQEGRITDLGTLPGLDQSEAHALNDAGQVVGTAYRDGRGEQPRRAFLWRGGASVDLNDFLPPGSGWTLESAIGINARGQIAGSGRYAGQRRAFLLTPIARAPGPCDAPFADVPGDHAACTAIVALTAAGIVNGYATTPPSFGPADDVQRAQLAAFVVRALGWQGGPQGPRTFPDLGPLAGELRTASLILANACAEPGDAATCVARGYGDGRFGPADGVSYAQAISLVTRAFERDPDRAWQPRPGTAPPYGGVPAAHDADVRTYHFYTQSAGGIPGAPAGDGWDRPAPRAWVALVLHQALQAAP